MGDTVRVPAEKIAALQSAVMLWGPDYTHPLATAARAVVDAVGTEAAPDELTALRERIRALANKWEADSQRFSIIEWDDAITELRALLAGADDRSET